MPFEVDCYADAIYSVISVNQKGKTNTQETANSSEQVRKPTTTETNNKDLSQSDTQPSYDNGVPPVVHS